MPSPTSPSRGSTSTTWPDWLPTSPPAGVACADDPEQGPVEGGCTPVNVVGGTGTQRDYLGAVTEALGLEPVWEEGEAWTGTLVADRARRWGWTPQMDLDCRPGRARGRPARPGRRTLPA